MKSVSGKRGYTAATMVFAAALCSGNVASAEEYSIKKGEFAGSFETSFFTFNGETVISTIANGSTDKKGPGEYQSQTLSDLTYFSPARYCKSADGQFDGIAFFVSKSRAVLTFKKGQLYLEAGSGSAPVNPDGCMYVDTNDGQNHFELGVTYNVTGGSGKFSGASGSLYSESEGVVLEATEGYVGDALFGATTGKLSGDFCTDCP
ncbi:hypothetical protein ACNKU7_02025 [Microbulbifer sp. SA54]|uniref:hypothetical protein n=1 Tax=Microbulbifer sp. SA54 TaxID=3401577 RepID=UPI003AAE609D